MNMVYKFGISIAMFDYQRVDEETYGETLGKRSTFMEGTGCDCHFWDNTNDKFMLMELDIQVWW